MEIKMDSSESDVIPIITDHVNSYEEYYSLILFSLFGRRKEMKI